MSNFTQDQIDALINGASSPDETAEVSKPSGEIDISAYSQAAPGQAEADNNPDSDADNSGATALKQSGSQEQLEKELELLDKSNEYLSSEEKDILGEMGNICMGASATTMYTLLGRRVNITTPQVHVYTSGEVLSIYKSPFVVVSVEYSKGVDGKNLLILKESDSALITDLLMGGDGEIDPDNIELDEIHMSAMSEIMNQMIGASATSLSNLLGCAIDITPPRATAVGLDMDVSELLDGSQLVIKVSFDMEIEGLLKSKLMQIMPVETGKKLARALLDEANPKQNANTNNSQPKSPAAETPKQTSVHENRPQEMMNREEEARPVRVKPFAYEAFDEEVEKAVAPMANPVIDLISDIPLQVAVELGKAKKSINDILGMGIGSVIVLDKMAGELVEVVVNGKHIARGEVVVIDENYGVRITDIDHAYC